MTRRLVPLTLAAALAAAALAAPGQALAVNALQSVVVSENPADFTPQVENGEVDAVAVVGNTVVIGGTFTQISDATESTPAVTRNYIAAFDATTGVLNATFRPALDGPVTSLVAGADSTVYVGGHFAHVDGAAEQGLARLNVPSGTRALGFSGYVGNNTGGGSQVNALSLRGTTLYVAGRFSAVRGVARSALAAVNADTGLATSFNVPVTGSRTTKSLTPFVSTMDVTADGTTMVIGGNFLKVGGQPREQAAVISLMAGAVTGWQTTDFHPPSIAGNDTFFTYVNQVGISPDGKYFVVVTTGGKTDNSLCDSASRWELGVGTAGQHPTWVDYTGGDTLTSVAITGAAVYVAGHPRWFNNFLGNGNAGPGSVARQTIAALDVASGLPLPWDPNMARPGPTPGDGEGPRALLATAQGLWVGWDADTIGTGATQETHKRITFFPTTGGTTPPPATPTTLPGTIVIAGADGSLKTRSISAAGTTFGAATAVSNPGTVDWSQVVGGVLAAGRIFYAAPAGTLNLVSFDGSTVGTSFVVATDGWTDLASVESMTYDNGRLYYTNGDGKLYYRFFLPSSAIVGTQEFTASASGVFGDTRQMFIANGAMYLNHAGELYRIAMVGGALSGAATLVSNDGSWTGTAAMLSSTPRPVLPPAYEHDFTGDGHGDVLARDPSGFLWIYQGNGAGKFATRIRLGSGWNGMNALATPGDFDGDGRADVIARDTSGRLWLYPGKAPAMLGLRVQIGSGWQTMTAIVGEADFDGDGLPDVLARDPSGLLWLYSGNGRNGFSHRSLAGTGWNGMNALTQSGPVAGQHGLIARQASTGQLWLYQGNGHGGFVGRRLIGIGWSGMSAIVGGVYMNSDGFPDVVARQHSTGQLWTYLGTSTGAFSGRVQAGTGWNVMTAIA